MTIIFVNSTNDIVYKSDGSDNMTAMDVQNWFDTTYSYEYIISYIMEDGQSYIYIPQVFEKIPFNTEDDVYVRVMFDKRPLPTDFITIEFNNLPVTISSGSVVVSYGIIDCTSKENIIEKISNILNDIGRNNIYYTFKINIRNRSYITYTTLLKLELEEQVAEHLMYLSNVFEDIRTNGDSDFEGSDFEDPDVIHDMSMADLESVDLTLSLILR